MNSNRAEKVAVFVDVENLAGWLKTDGAETILDRAAELGSVVVRRAYGDFSNPGVMARQLDLNRTGFEFVHVYHPVRGKNSADIQIAVDVMDYAWRVPDVQWFVLATGDADFSPLFRRLREIGRNVVGMGPRSALSESVKTSCNRYLYLESAEHGPDAGSARRAARVEAVDLLERALGHFDGVVDISALKGRMLLLDASFDERALGHRRFLDFLRSADESVDLIYDEERTTWRAEPLAVTAGQVVTDASFGEERDSGAEGPAPATADPDAYQRLLQRDGWPFVRTAVVRGVFGVLSEALEPPVRLAEARAAMVERLGDQATYTEIRKALDLLTEAELLLPYDRPGADRRWVLGRDVSASRLADRLDEALLGRLRALCAEADVPFEHERAGPLLFGPPDGLRVWAICQQLVAREQAEEEDAGARLAEA